MTIALVLNILVPNSVSTSGGGGGSFGFEWHHAVVDAKSHCIG